MRIILLFLLGVILFSCSEKNNSKQVFSDYFYPYDTIPKIYVYRDVVGGFNEQFHRVYGISDEAGKHVVVEIYSLDFRLTEALNYNCDKLDLQDHMVTNRKKQKTKSELIKNGVFPKSKKDTCEFLSRFPSHIDSSKIIQYQRRTVNKTNDTVVVLNKKIDAISFYDSINMTVVNFEGKPTNNVHANKIVYFAKGLGMVEWHSVGKKAHYRLEKIITQKEWLNIIKRFK